jgi:uncharacterized repeat protein (TIGR03806 family)
MNARHFGYICAALVAAVQPLHAQEFTWSGTFERQLSAYRIFEDPARQVPAPGFVLYDVITPLFTDYADKHRFVYIPEGRSMNYDPDQAFAMPAGSVLVKTFSYPLDARHPEQGRRLVETRLMVHTPSGWTGAAYLWNEAQTDATLKVAGAEVPVDWIDEDGYCRSIKYLVPDMNQCKNCHRDTTGSMQPISIKARHLNRDAPDGAGNQLARWVREGILDRVPAEGVPALARWDDARESLAARALAYLEMNCAHCHNPNGLASHTRLDLRWIQDDPAMRGVMKRPTSSGNASRDRYFAIVPGDAPNSFLLHRMASNRPDVRMPPVGRTTAHDEAVDLIGAWIDSL